MYIRKRVPGQDDPILIKMVTEQFKVRTELITTILKQAHEGFVVCDEEHVVVGFVSYRFKLMDMVYVDYVVLDESHQGKGIATRFLPVFEEHFLKQGIRKIYGTVDEDNTDAIRLFQRWGFKVMGKLGSSVIIEKYLHEIQNKNAPPPVNYVNNESQRVKTVKKATEPVNHVTKLSEPPSLK